MRWNTYLGSGLHLLNAICKYGRNNFKRDIVDIAYSAEELNLKEEEWIREYNAVADLNYYNMVEGGNVAEHLVDKNSIPIVCIDNNMVFKSIKDASIWSGYTALTIKNTFKKIHSFNNEKETLIFRPLTHVKPNRNLCCVCGNNFKRELNRQKICKRCINHKINDNSILIISHNFIKSSRSGIKTYSLMDEWVINDIAKAKNNSRNKKIISEENMPIEKKKKPIKKSNTVITKKQKLEILQNNKEKIIDLYMNKNKSINNIKEILNIKGIDGTIIKEGLTLWGIDVKTYRNLVDDKFIFYLGVYDRDMNLLEVFKYKHEARNWVKDNIFEAISFSSGKLNRLIKSGEEYRGVLFKEINECIYRDFKTKEELNEKTKQNQNV